MNESFMCILYQLQRLTFIYCFFNGIMHLLGGLDLDIAKDLEIFPDQTFVTVAHEDPTWVFGFDMSVSSGSRPMYPLSIRKVLVKISSTAGLSGSIPYPAKLWSVLSAYLSMDSLMTSYCLMNISLTSGQIDLHLTSSYLLTPM